MKTSLFDFELPEHLIASEPAYPRDTARMLVVKGKQGVIHSRVAELPDYLKADDVIVLNNTKVIPARLKGRRGEANIEIMLHKSLDHPHRWQVFAKPGKRLKVNDTIMFADDFSAIVLDKLPNGELHIQFECRDFYKSLHRYGTMPLPPYIKRNATSHDNQTYQTVYAVKEGAIAAPTAGLHFTEDLLENLKNRGIRIVYVTLHVGAGTFQPVKVEDTSEHVMHSEYAEISQESADIINQAKKAGNRIVAVGTTSMRVLESAADVEGLVQPYKEETSIFITPGYDFRVVDILITNFHLPRSTLFMLVSAFCGLESIKQAYQQAIKENYRFYSYGDACLLFKHNNFP